MTITTAQAGQGFDLIINCASGAVSTTKLMTLLIIDGTLVQVGIPGGGAQMTLPLQVGGGGYGGGREALQWEPWRHWGLRSGGIVHADAAAAAAERRDVAEGLPLLALAHPVAKRWR